ncbi:MAG: translation initiation factor IF-2 [bacterium]|nr:translation initiation factor IF-2 [bacterium]
MGSKLRIYQVAKEFNISIEALTKFLNKGNFEVRGPNSPVTDEMYQEISTKFSKDIKISEGDSDIKRQLKEKRASEEEKKRKETLDFEKKVEIASQVMSEIPRRRRETIMQKATPRVEDIAVAEPEPPIAPKSRRKAEPEIADGAATRIAPDKIESAGEPSQKSRKAEKIQTPVEHEKSWDRDVKKPTEETSEPVAVDKKAKGHKDVVTKTNLEALPKITPTKETHLPEKGEPQEKSDKDSDLKFIQKVDAIKKGRQPEKEDALSILKRKKLKKKDRLAQIKKLGEVEEATPDQDSAAKKKKKKKKRIERVEPKPVFERPKRKSKKKKKFVISDEEVEQSIRQTFAAMEETARSKKRKRRIRETDEDDFEDANILRVSEYISVADLAKEMEVETSEVIKKCLELGLLVTINQRLDIATIEIVADEFGYKVEIIPEFGSDILEDLEEEDDDEQKLKPRSPVVTIMGHVDHGKTSLLDFIRHSNIIDGEAGGITQHIGAYQVNADSKNITFLDTPGHEAFTAMRARGAQATDIVVLVVAADDNVMPQTIEAIDHAKAAGVPIIVALNKIDKPELNLDLIKRQLADNNVLIEEWGGKNQCVEVSAKTGHGIDKLLESILVESDLLELKANPDRLAKGVVIESKLDKGKGATATVLVQKGTLKIGAPFIVGQYSGKVRGLFDEFGNKRQEAGPSVPVQVIGFSGLPQAGDPFIVLHSEKDTRQISLERQLVKREKEYRFHRPMTLDEISQQIKKGGVKELSLVIKGDVDGSVEAINDSLIKLSGDEVTVKVIRKGVGGISESDVLLASASRAIIIGFQVRPTIQAREIATKEKVDIRLYKVIYDAISDVRNALEGLLEPDILEENLGTVEVRQTFKVPKIGTVAGCHVQSGKISRNDLVRLYHEDKLTYEGRLSSLKRFKDDVKEVVAGFECGVGLERFDDIKIGDIIEAYKLVAVKRKLSLTQATVKN